MTDTPQLSEALALALKLSPKERIRLIEQVASSVERDFEVAPPTEGHWGQELSRLLETLDTREWEALDIDDPVEWVKTLRRQDLERLDPYWKDNL